MKRPTSTHTDSSAGPEWYRYWDAIGDAASTGHGLEVTWDGGIVYVEINETRGGDILTFHPCRPQWVACWTVHPIDDEAGTSIVADGDPRLLPVADGPALDADSHEVGEWIATERALSADFAAAWSFWPVTTAGVLHVPCGGAL